MIRCRVYFYLTVATLLGFITSVQSQSLSDVINADYNTYYEMRDSLDWYYNRDSIQGDTLPGFKEYVRWSLFWDDRVDSAGSFDGVNDAIKDFVFERLDESGEETDFSNAKWKIIGPVENKFNDHNPPMARMGLISALWVDTTDYQTILAGSNSGGLFKSTDGGEFWNPLTEDVYAFGISSIIVHPDNSSKIFISTGVENGVLSNNYGFGVLKTSNGGVSWDTAGLNELNYRIADMVMDEAHPDTMFALATFKDGLNSRSLIFRTTNGTTLWVKKDTLPVGEFLYDIDFRPEDSATLFACGTRLFRTSDCGNTWSDITDNLGLDSTQTIYNTKIDIASYNPDKVLVVVFGVDTNAVDTGLFRRACLSYDGGSTFSVYKYYRFLDGSLRPAYPNYDSWKNALEFSESDTNVFYIGGIDFYKFAFASGNDTAVIQQERWENFHPDTRSLIICNRNDADYILNGNDGGITMTPNGGDEWFDKTGYGLSVTQFYGLGIHPEANFIMGGTQDGNDCIYYQKDSSWIYPG